MYDESPDTLDSIEMPSEIKLPSPLGTPEKKGVGEVAFYWLDNEEEWMKDDAEHRSHAYDGDPSGVNGPASNVLREAGMWNTDDPQHEHWLKFNLQGLHECDSFRYTPTGGPESPRECQLEALHHETDEWMVVKKWSAPNIDMSTTVTFAPRTAREWKFRVLNTHGAGVCLRAISFRGRSVLVVPEEQLWLGDAVPEEQLWLGDEEFDFATRYLPSDPVDERLVDAEQLNGMTMAAEATHEGPISFTVSVYENQRYPPPFVGKGEYGGEFLLPTERGNLAHQDGTGDYYWTAGYGHPIIRCPVGWRWADDWSVLMDGSGDKGGWGYAAIFARAVPFTARRGALDYVRRRRWERTCVMAAPEASPQHPKPAATAGKPAAPSSSSSSSSSSRSSSSNRVRIGKGLPVGPPPTAALSYEPQLVEQSPEGGTLGGAVASLQKPPREYVEADLAAIAGSERHDNATLCYGPDPSGCVWEIRHSRKLNWQMQHTCQATVTARLARSIESVTAAAASADKPYPATSGRGEEIWRERQRERAASAGRPPGGSSQVGGRMEAAKDTMGQNLKAVHERGEKIGQIQDKSEEMKHESANFASAARRMRQKAEADAKKSFFGGLF